MASEALARMAPNFFLGGVVSLLTMTNPLSKLPVFLTLSVGVPSLKAHREVLRACLSTFLLLVVGLFAGVVMLDVFLAFPSGRCALLAG